MKLIWLSYWLVILSYDYCDEVVKQIYSCWCKFDIFITEKKWYNACIWFWKSRSASFLKSNHEIMFAMMFFLNEIQNMTNSMSKSAAMRRIVYNDSIIDSLIDRLLMSSMTPKLSHARYTLPLIPWSCHKAKACKITNISLKSICFERWRERTCWKNIWEL